MPSRILLALIVSSLAFGCASEPTCADACENLESCGKLQDGVSACRKACEEDPTVLKEDVRCFADSTCAEMRACFHSTSPAVCWEMCGHVYDHCGLSLRSRDGELDKEGCLALCRTEMPENEAQCVRRSACNRISECL